MTVTAQAGAIGTVTAIAPMHACVTNFDFTANLGFEFYGGSLRAAAVVITTETTTGAA